MQKQPNQSQLIEQIRKLWSDLLERPQIGVLDDFFEAGGSSMQVIEMLSSVSKMFHKNIDHMAFFKEPSIRKLAELIES